MLGYYAERLNGVELNNTFYRTPPPATFARWIDETHPGFRFCLKAHRGLTYSAPGFDREGLARVLAPQFAQLGDRRGPVLLQWPPSRRRDAALLDGVLTALGLPAAVEFREESWFEKEVYAVLRAHQAALVVTDAESWPLAPRLELAPFAYYRLRRKYDSATAARWRAELRIEAANREEVHVYFKHDAEGPGWALLMLAS